jgi:TonB family protein
MRAASLLLSNDYHRSPNSLRTKRLPPAFSSGWRPSTMCKPLLVLLLTLVAFPFSAPADDTVPADEKPVPITRAIPQFPKELREKRLKGEVLTEFVIDVNGRVKNATVIRSTHPALEAHALETVRQWLFRPARKGGVSIESRVRQTLVFSYADESEPQPSSAPRSRSRH